MSDDRPQMLTPSEALAVAADKLGAMANSATPELRLDDIESGLFPEDIAYIETMNPLVGKALAEWLLDERVRVMNAGSDPNSHALELARLIISGSA